jgi:hypothetical protein
MDREAIDRGEIGGDGTVTFDERIEEERSDDGRRGLDAPTARAPLTDSSVRRSLSSFAVFSIDDGSKSVAIVLMSSGGLDSEVRQCE